MWKNFVRNLKDSFEIQHNIYPYIDILSVGPIQTNFSEIWIVTLNKYEFWNTIWKMSRHFVQVSM